MTAEQRAASIRRHSQFLSPAEHAAYMPTEAELLARDRTYALAKESGLLDRLMAHRALNEEVNRGPRS